MEKGQNYDLAAGADCRSGAIGEPVWPDGDAVDGWISPCGRHVLCQRASVVVVSMFASGTGLNLCRQKITTTRRPTKSQPGWRGVLKNARVCPVKRLQWEYI